MPRGQVYDDLDDRGYLALPIPVAPPAADASSAAADASSAAADASSAAADASSAAADASSAADGDASHPSAGSTLRAFDAAAFFRRRAPSDAEREPLEQDLATRFYQTLYRLEGHQP